MEPTHDRPVPDLTAAALDVCTLGDALVIGLDLCELFGHRGRICAVWLGTDDGTMRDFVICAEDSGREIEHLVRYAAVTAGLLDASRAVLWRSVGDLAGDPSDDPDLAADFFDHRDLLEEAGLQLVDEIVLGGDELRSLAIATFSDEPGWDDVQS